MHIKFTRVKYQGSEVYKETNKSVWIPVEDLKRAIVRQEKNFYTLIFLGKEQIGVIGGTTLENVKEDPIKLLKKYEEEQEEGS